jgi:hypothetical protein
MKQLKLFTALKTLINSVCALILVISFSSCIQSPSNSRSKAIAKNSITGSGANGSTNGNGAVGATTTTTTTTTAVTSQKVELSHLVDPFDGTYKKKLTLPKNFKGNLYIAGLNVASLTNKIVSVRFNFGVDKQSVVLNATVARAPGIVPKTDIQVLVLDMNAKPFNKMRLGYDLYDYNDYTDAKKEMVSDGRDGGLYCRGLKLEDDPTFIPMNNTSTCSSATDRCLYSYAKVTDTTLYKDQVVNLLTYRVSAIPTHPQIWTQTSLNNYGDSVCLPDDSDPIGINNLFDLNLVSLGFNDPINFIYPVTIPLLPSKFLGFYQGPYRAINDLEWQISGAALFSGTAGLFEYGPIATNLKIGYHSLLFPRAGRLSLSSGINYLGSETHFGVRSKLTSDASGTTKFVDGCNLRVQNYDPATNESIGSCNVNASIEIFYMLDGKEVNITTDKSIKLQLIRPSLTNFEGKEVLANSFKRCDSSSTCGGDECCFNSRCWSKDLVTQCVDQLPIIGNQEIGANCSSDFECSTLCCNQSTGSCAPHNPNGTNPNYCNKSSGQQCVAKEFCQQVPVVTCKIVKSGLKADGTTACTLRCPAVMTYGDCTAGSCVPPATPAVPNFDPNDCSTAVDP